MTFAEPQILYLLVLVPVLVLFVKWATHIRKTDMHKLGDISLLQRLTPTINRKGRNYKVLLWFISFVLIIVALSRPQWGTELNMVERRGIQIMVVLDISQSMLAEDIQPNRLSRAKLEVLDLMDRLSGSEIGLVLFAGDSFIQLPMTSDHSTARMFLENSNPELISRPGTAIEQAIGTALKGFDTQRTSQKVIVLITDGEGGEGDPLLAAMQAAKDDTLIYSLGIGSSSGEPIPQYNSTGILTGYKKDSNDKIILSKLDEYTLKEIASITGGRYYQFNSTNNAIKDLMSDLERLDKDKLESQFETLKVERFQIFLLIAFMALVLTELIPDGSMKLVHRWNIRS